MKHFYYKKTVGVILLLASPIILKSEDSPKWMRSGWLVAANYELDITPGAYLMSRWGVSGAYLNNWGGYLKVSADYNGLKATGRGGWFTPSVSAGFTKRLGRIESCQSTLYLYGGMGYANVVYTEDYWDSGNWDNLGGILFETGCLYRLHKGLTVGLGCEFRVSPSLYSGSTVNIGPSFTVGYCF